MAWLDDRIWCHPKLEGLSDSAFRIWVHGIAYSSGFSTHGVLTQGTQRMIGARSKPRAELIAAGLWEEVNRGEVLIHDWKDHNDKRDAKRAADRERKRRQRDKERDSERDVTRDIHRDSGRERRALKNDGVTSEEEGSGVEMVRLKGMPFALTRLLESAGVDALSVAGGRIARAASGLPEASLEKVRESLNTNGRGISNPVGYVIRGLESERAERGAA